MVQRPHWRGEVFSDSSLVAAPPPEHHFHPRTRRHFSPFQTTHPLQETRFCGDGTLVVVGDIRDIHFSFHLRTKPIGAQGVGGDAKRQVRRGKPRTLFYRRRCNECCRWTMARAHAERPREWHPRGGQSSGSSRFYSPPSQSARALLNRKEHLHGRS